MQADRKSGSRDGVADVSPAASGKAAGARRVERPRRKSRTRVRVLIWVIEITALAAAVEYFVVRPLLDGSKKPAAPPSEPVAAVLEPVPVLGDTARKLAGLREVVPAYFAPLKGLADGSVAARESQALVSREARLPVEMVNSLGMRFRLIPPGTFLMGSPTDEKGRGDVEKQHVAVVSTPLYMGAYEVTQAQWEAVMGDAPAHFKGDDRPVEEITWYDCQRFAIALCEKEGLPSGTYRLSTEVEWEYACRAGTATAYCFGDDPGRLGQYADFEGNNYRETNRVGRRLPNAYGLYDMHGNVWEWCADRFGPYPDAPPIEADKTEWRIVRGGHWRDAAENCRSANRCRLPPLSHGNMLGLRLVRVLAEFSVPADAAAGKPAVIAPD